MGVGRLRLYFRRRQVVLGLFHKDVEVAHAAQGTAGASQSLEEAPEGVGVEVGGKDAEGGTHAAGGDAHVVQFLDILPQPCARLVFQHAHEVEE